MGLDAVEIVMALEKRFEIVIPDERVGKVYTVQDLSNLVWSLTDPRQWPSSTVVLSEVTTVIAEQMVRDPDSISPGDTLTGDIGID